MKKSMIIAAAAIVTLCFGLNLRAQRAHFSVATAGQATPVSREIQALRDQAFDGDAKAQFKLAFMYENGKGGLPKDMSYAMSWYEEAARNGSKAASKKIKSL